MNFILFGANGFLGSHVEKSLLEMGHNVVNVGRSTDVNNIHGQYDVLVDASSQKKTSELDSLLYRVDIVARRCEVKQIIVLSSFSTLQSQILCSEKFNFGASCEIYTPYTYIKQYKEKIYLEIIKTARIKFIYLPIILGDHGIWNKLLSRVNSTTYTPKLDNIYVINAKNVAQSIIYLAEQDVSRCTAYEISNWRDLLTNSTSIEVDMSDLGVLKYLALLFRNKNISYIGYFLAAILMRIRYKSYIPNLFYWFVFAKQDKCLSSFSKYNFGVNHEQ